MAVALACHWGARPTWRCDKWELVDDKRAERARHMSGNVCEAQ